MPKLDESSPLFGIIHCDHLGCFKTNHLHECHYPDELLDDDVDTLFYYCEEHAPVHGFCPRCCNEYSIDTTPRIPFLWCDQCVEDFAQQEEDEVREEIDPYDDSPYLYLGSLEDIL